jgi:hypothetical protein
MRTSSTRLRFGAALAVTTLGLFSLGGSAFAGEKGQGNGHRNDRAAAGKTEVPTEVADDDDSVTPDPDGDADNAHPSGKDRHEDKGTQGKSTSDPDDDGRGPDRSNGGPDKPFAGADGTGGVDQGDQDGNNGCGNDDDFEDDNEGWCGSKPKRANTAPVPSPGEVDGDDDRDEIDESDEITCPAGMTMPAGGTTEADCVGSTTVEEGQLAEGAVLGNQLQNETPAALVATPIETKVLGVSIERAAPAGAVAADAIETKVLGVSIERGAGAVLARTGFGLTIVGLLGLALVLVGAGLQRAGRHEQH